MNCRHIRDMTQQGLSVQTGLSRQFISKMESGAQMPSIPTLLIIAEGLEMTLEQLFCGIEKVYYQLLFVQSNRNRSYSSVAEQNGFCNYINRTKGSW